MQAFLENIDFNQMFEALIETLFMTGVSLIIAVIVGLILGILIYSTQDDGLYPHLFVNKILNWIVNILRAIPFIILLILSSAPFYGRMVMIALNEVDKGTIEASKAMGATNLQIVMKILIPEAKPALISSISVMGISLVGYTAMAGAIGAGGLGNLAYLYGFVRQNNYVTYMATALILVIVFIIQFAGDYAVRKIDRR